MHRILFALLPCLVLAACGSGGGSADGEHAAAAPLVGSRAVPEGVVEVRRTSATTFRASASVPGIQALAVLRGASYATAAPVALVAADGGWTGTGAAGDDLLVRLTLGDGSVIETAPGDFILP